ncbi:MAG: alanyl-tRNA editing protein [Erysipelotrichaceae bacterium]
MAVRKVFWEDPYLTTLHALVTSVEGGTITMDQTIFYAFSGGQASDRGTIGGYPVLDARKVDLEIDYLLPEMHELEVGDEVEILIDADHRDKLRRLHIAAELVLELVYQNFGHPEKIGANITSEKARVDFSWTGNIASTFQFLNVELEKMIAADLPIISCYTDVAHERRTWEILGFARVSCGGTHPRSTQEIGALALRRINLGGNKERIEITLR